MAQFVQKHLVVARYKEDVTWVNQLKNWNAIVIQKQTEELVGDMPNAGREPSSFFFAVGRNYDSIQPDDIWAFVQGNPFDHCPELFTELERSTKGFRWLGSARKITDGTGKPEHPNLPVADKYKEWLERKWSENITFCPGGQFVLLGRNLLHYPREWYLRLMDDFTTAYNAWVAERLWGKIYADEK